MSKIVYIRDVKSSRLLRIGVRCEQETVGYTVSESFYAELDRPPVGYELSEAELSSLEYADECCRAEKKALSLLALADNNTRTLTRKLCAGGIRREIAEDVCKNMVMLGYIDERRQLRRLILSEALDKLYGPSKIIPRLAAKGYSVSDIKTVMRELVSEGTLDFSENAKALIEKKFPDDTDGEEKKKLLYKRGFKIC